MSIQREPMSAVDTAWLRMESPSNLMMIGSVLILEQAVDVDRFKQIIQERLLKFSRFRQRVTHVEERPCWEEDPHFHIDNHIHLIGLPGQDRQEDLQRLASDLISTPLNLTHPLWQIHVVESYQGGSALIFRIHHCIADGISLVRVMLSLTDVGAVPPPQEHHENTHHSLMDHLLTPALNWLKHEANLGEQLFHGGLDLIEHPQHLLDLAREGAAITSEVARIAAMPTDPPSCFKGTLGGRKNVSWSASLPLEEVKHTAKLLGATINDILLTATTGALRRYLLARNEEHNGELDIARLHAAVPFNLRPLDQPITTLGNQFGLVIVPLPVGIHQPLMQLEQIRNAMHALKHSYQAQVFYGLLGVFGKGPSILEQTALEILSKKASLVMTNVPGPKHALYLAGCQVRQPIFWVPQSGEVGMGLSILSYHNTVQFGVVADQQLIPDPDQLVAGFKQSYLELKRLADDSLK
ncbi:hypothetical protein BTA51_00260 [Hahella sp. CCB-MM4]|uniref:WS/DGAT/MGAT family O-acyltransferase n=1 Tax=Hahella sp. (strain CCB-MM4) TaxID=1926491 RepID=UPI000B9C135B|nr:wax ester/triacylglycerol synthase family O-acyltransferase [Hahella sp. CCB-MM4]OZG74879.1 hypothetical protein BTA51_00260 [Hahella sp. CCB-MM4]